MAGIPLPKLPTDNLYKFVALAGLTLIVLGVYVPEHHADAILERWAPIVRRVSILHRRLERLQEGIKDSKAETARLDRERSEEDGRIDALLNLLKARKLTEEEGRTARDADLRIRETLKGDLEALSVVAKKNIEAVDTLESDNADVGADIEAAQLIETDSRWINRLGRILIAVGALCAMWGFYYWYTRIQKFHDRAIAAEAAEKRAS